MKKIAIIGATGMIGQPVTKAFINAGFEVTILVRNIEKAQAIFRNAVNYIRGDLKDVESVKKLLSQQDYLYINLSVEPKSRENDFQPERDGLDNVLAAVKDSGLKRIGYLSSLVQQYEGQHGFSWWVFKLKQQAVSKIKSSHIPYVVFYPSTFMENFDKGAYRQGDFITLAGTSAFRMFLVAADDYGKQVVKTFELDNGNQEFIIQGQEGFTADEAAGFYRKHCTTSNIKVVKAPLKMLRLMGYFINKFHYGAKIIEALNNYPEKFEAEKTWEMLGKPATKFEDYINTQ